MTLVIIGPKGVGKSTLAKFLGESMGLSVYSTDKIIGESIETLGEDEFRKRETEALKVPDVIDIIDTGGGAILHNSDTLKELGSVLYLRRPNDRDHLYKEIADLTVEVEL